MLMSRLSHVVGAGAIALSASALAGQSAQVCARFTNLPKASYTITTVSTAKESIPARGEFGEKMERREYGVLIEPLEHNSENVKLRLTYERILFEITSQAVQLKFDSDVPVEEDKGNLLASTLRPLVGVQLEMLVSPSGDVSNIEVLSDGINVGPASPLDPFLNADALEVILGPILGTYHPDGTAEEGQTWKKQIGLAIPPLTHCELFNEYTLESVGAGTTKIMIDGSIQADLGSTPGEVKTSDVAGHILWDTETASLIDYEMTSDLDIKVVSRGDEASLVLQQKRTIKRNP